MLADVLASVATEVDSELILYVKELESAEFVMPTTFSNASIESFALACCAACPTNSSVDDGLDKLSLLVGNVLAMLPPGGTALDNYTVCFLFK